MLEVVPVYRFWGGDCDGGEDYRLVIVSHLVIDFPCKRDNKFYIWRPVRPNAGYIAYRSYSSISRSFSFGGNKFFFVY